MVRTTTWWWTVMAPVLALMCIGASCSGGESGNSENSGGTGSGSDQAPTTPARSRIERIDGVDLSELTAAERRIFLDVVNDQLSPCGEPTSVARCAQETHSCRTCVPAARYVVRLISEGFERSEIEEMYTARFGRDSRLDVNIEGHPTSSHPSQASIPIPGTAGICGASNFVTMSVAPSQTAFICFTETPFTPCFAMAFRMSDTNVIWDSLMRHASRLSGFAPP
jgi:hypothetical protein